MAVSEWGDSGHAKTPGRHLAPGAARSEKL
jgi:hypothetical protein